jgi:uncharacterized protein (TIGR02246 family)
MRETRRRRLGIALAGLAFVACAPAVTVNRQTEEAAIRAGAAEFQSAVTARDVDRLVRFYAPDAVLLMSNSPAVSGTDAIRTSFRDFVNLPGLSFSFTPTRIDITGPDAATEVGTYRMSFNGPHGRVTDAGNYVTAWRKIDGQWRIVTDATVSTTPMSAAMAGMPMDMMMDASDMEMRMGGGLTWSDLKVPGFDPGAKIAVLHGDPGSKGDYTLRLQFPGGYRFPVHWHPGAEHVSVLSGTFLLGMGNTANASAIRTYGPGDFLYIPARHAHFGGATGTTVIQLHGTGPFEIKLGAPQ